MRVVTIALLISFASAAGAVDKGFFGFALRTEFDGSWWSPVLATAYIGEVVPGSPTAKAGIVVGDVLLEIEGLKVPGAKGDDLKKLKAVFETPPAVGEQRHLKLRRANGDEYSAVLIAEPRKQ